MEAQVTGEVAHYLNQVMHHGRAQALALPSVDHGDGGFAVITAGTDRVAADPDDAVAAILAGDRDQGHVARVVELGQRLHQGLARRTDLAGEAVAPEGGRERFEEIPLGTGVLALDRAHHYVAAVAQGLGPARRGRPRERVAWVRRHHRLLRTPASARPIQYPPG